MVESQPAGCKAVASAAALLMLTATVLFATGLTLINQDSCRDLCETFGLTSLYAGGPVSAAVGVPTDTVVAAWPLDLIMWVALSFWIAKRAERANRSPVAYALGALIVALVYGLVLSRFVELAV